MAGYTQDRRKQIVVNKPMQSRLILKIALLPAIALAGIAIFTAVYCTRVMDEAIATDSEMPNLMPLFYLVIVFELLAAIFLMVNSLKISHTVAGPAYRICKSLERIRSGDLAFTVFLRKGDHLVEIKDELNRLLDWLNEHPPAGCTTRSMAARIEAERTEAEQDEAEATTAAPSTTAAATAVTHAAGENR